MNKTIAGWPNHLGFDNQTVFGSQWVANMENLHELVVRELEAVGRDGWPPIADATGVSIHTIIKIANGEIESPRYATLEPLVRYFRPGLFGPPAAAPSHENA